MWRSTHSSRSVIDHGESVLAFGGVVAVGYLIGYPLQRFDGLFPRRELLMFLVFFASALSLSTSADVTEPDWTFSSLLVICLAWVAAIDLRHHVVHDAWCIVIASCGTLFHFVSGDELGWLSATVLAGLIAFAALPSREGSESAAFGSGDLTFLAACVAWIGPVGVILALCVATPVLMIAAALAMLADRKDVPLCPAAAIGVALVWLGYV